MDKMIRPARARAIGIAAPFALALLLIVAGLLHPVTGIGAEDNWFALTVLGLLVVALIAGIVALFRASSIPVWLRLLIAVMYLPTALFIVLGAGF